MAREEFIDSLRRASQALLPPRVTSGQGAQRDAYLSSKLDSADLWLTPKSVEGFDPADFRDWPQDDRDELAKEVAGFLAIAKQVPANKPATKIQSQRARKHLEAAIRVVRRRLLHEWLEAQKQMISEATAAARAKGWYVEEDEKEVRENLLGIYKAPRLRIRTPDKEVVLDPIAFFGSGRRGVVDLVVMPTYETKYLVMFQNGDWQIVSPRRTLHRRPFNQTTLVNTITHLSHN
jgi:hypothetical protein